MKQDEIARLLPGIFQQTIREGTPLFALLAIMEALHTPDEAVLDQLEAFFNPYRTSDSFVPFLASWVDLDWLLANTAKSPSSASGLPSGIGRLRELIASAVFLAQWRGTARGLLHFLETACGLQGFSVEERLPGPDGRPRPFHITIQIPPEAVVYQTMIIRIIEAEKPAYVTYDLQIKEKLV